MTFKINGRGAVTPTTNPPLPRVLNFFLQFSIINGGFNFQNMREAKYQIQLDFSLAPDEIKMKDNIAQLAQLEAAYLTTTFHFA